MAIKVKIIGDGFYAGEIKNQDRINKQLEKWNKKVDTNKVEVISTTAFNWKDSNTICYVITYKEQS